MGSRIFDWFLTSQARKVVSNLIAVAGFGVAAAHILPHSVFIDKYIDVVQMYRNGEKVPLSDAVVHRAEGVLKECKFTEGDASVFQFFTVFGLEMFHVGSTKLRGGPFVGIPHTFCYGSIGEVEKDLLLVNGSKFNYGSSVGQELLNSLILSERAQKYAIAREIHACTTQYVYLRGLIATASLFLTYCLAYFVNTRFNFLKLPRTPRIVMYGFTSSIGYMNYIMLKDGLAHYYDKAADEAACNMGKEYVLGGIEFYEKLLARNRALRDALGAKGKTQYTMFGNEEVFLRTKTIPVTARLDIVKDALKDIENQEEKVQSNAANN